MTPRKMASAATALVFIALFAGGLHTGSMRVILSSLILLLAVPPFLLTDGHGEGRNRPTAAFCSVLVPGAAHLYLRQYRKGAMFLWGCALASGDLLLLTIYRSEPDEYMIIASFIAIVFGMYFLSAVDAERTCNKLGLPYTGDPYELRVKSYPLAYMASVSAPFALVLAVCAGAMVSGPGASTDLAMAILGAWATALAVCAVWAARIGQAAASP
ncbi:MAG: hypothetical protein FWH47_06095 [Methanomassiliicoccaceae archaeon]|nr:hypothetical protein [Methanomassiliicoccaceae archaeon]